MHPDRDVSTSTMSADQANAAVVFVSLELSRSTWLVSSLMPGSKKISKHAIPGGDGPALLDLLDRLRDRAARSAAGPIAVTVIQEAGLDGFWIHRLLEANGIESHVVDPASVAVARRRRRAKTDAIDGETLLRTLLAWVRGEAAGLLDGGATHTGTGGPSPALTGARHAAPGAGPTRQPDHGFARGSGHPQIRSFWCVSSLSWSRSRQSRPSAMPRLRRNGRARTRRSPHWMRRQHPRSILKRDGWTAKTRTIWRAWVVMASQSISPINSASMRW